MFLESLQKKQAKSAKNQDKTERATTFGRITDKKILAHKKMESNDSPQIPGRDETSEMPGLPSGQNKEKKPKKNLRRRSKRR